MKRTSTQTISYKESFTEQGRNDSAPRKSTIDFLRQLSRVYMPMKVVPVEIGGVVLN